MPASGESSLVVSEGQREQRRLMSTKTAITNDNIQAAVRAWCFNSTAAAETYGNISDWDTSGVTDGFASLFYSHCSTVSTFSEDLSRWNTSSATTMFAIFRGATDFSSDLSLWDVGRVENMQWAFLSATNFNGDVSSWNTAQVLNMQGMFGTAETVVWLSRDNCLAQPRQLFVWHSRDQLFGTAITNVCQAARGSALVPCLQ